MNKLLLIGFILLVVVFGGWWVAGKRGANMDVVESKVLPIFIDNGVVKLNVKGRVSMVDLVIKSEQGLPVLFESNGQVFNSEMINKLNEDGSAHVVLGVMKATSELPEGEIVVGTIKEPAGDEFVVGKVTISGEEEPSEIEVWSKETQE
jgi:hypothetical protein